MLVLVTFSALASAATCWLVKHGQYRRARLMSVCATIFLVVFAVERFTYGRISVSDKLVGQALILKDEQKFAEAERKLAEAVKEGSDKRFCYTKIAECQMARKDYDGAIATCKDLQPFDAKMAHALRGQAFERKGRLDMAKIEYGASYALGNEVAGASLSRLSKKGGVQ